MKGVVTGGVYRTALGKRAILHGEQIGREMGMSTWVSFAGTNDRALAQGEFVETWDDLQKVLKALRTKGINVASIRNHTLGEQPQLVFVRFWRQGTALELARALRYVLDVDFGAISLPANKI
jgi:biotin operon repressor